MEESLTIGDVLLLEILELVLDVVVVSWVPHALNVNKLVTITPKIK
ncbi:hypothetical protein C426_0387 [Lactococcus garvieae DCC43]|uniref:Uncharacterized protein n=1 Tax=Lactococcus garvieae DCC43 TaxID=1231377 RepID=K2PPD5_9LACT|nr:hypothetical protein C426_0387 [Lactococcus garvieae DCC43]